jgi:hypothetical protein
MLSSVFSPRLDLAEQAAIYHKSQVFRVLQKTFADNGRKFKPAASPFLLVFSCCNINGILDGVLFNIAH